MTNTVAVPPANQFGGPVTFTYGYDDLYRLTSATGSFEYQPGKVDRFDLTLTYDGIHNIKSKTQVHEIVQPGTTNPAIPQRKTSYAWIYDYTGAQPHAPSHIGQRAFLYDANGNQTGWDHDQNGTNRRIAWDEENRVQTITDTGHTTTYKYGAAGERVIKRGPQGETVYVNQFFTIRNREVGTKHIFTGASRAVSKMVAQDKPGANPQGNQPREKDLYFYHPDHLGSTAYVTDTEGKLYQHLQYFPFGETWVEQATNTQRTPYRFTGKELDEETGLYYFGARYFDPRTSVWQSTDPILGKYLPSGNKKNDENLSGMGGIFNSHNLGLYSYGHLNPVRLIDSDGREITVSETLTNLPSGNTLTQRTINFTAALTNTSGSLPQSTTPADLATRLEQQIEADYTQSFTDSKGNIVNYTMNADIKSGGSFVNFFRTFFGGRHNVKILAQGTGPLALSGGQSLIGRAPGFEKGRSIYISDQTLSTTAQQQNPNMRFERTGSHEFGHISGLRHPNDPNNPLANVPAQNLMTQTRSSGSHDVTQDQLDEIYDTFK